MPSIHLETYINASPQSCFDLSRSIDLHKVSTAHTGEEAIAGVTAGLIGLGERVTWRAVHFGIRQQLTVEISAFESPVYFQDRQVKGIFKSFTHDHYFEAPENGGTLMKDVFTFQSPFGLLGRLFNRFVLIQYMKKLLEQRNVAIKKFAEDNKNVEVNTIIFTQ